MSQYDFIYVSPISTLQHLINRQDIKENDIKKTIVKIIETASNLKKEVIAVSDAYYLDPNDMIAHKVFIFNKQLGGARHRLYSHHENNDVLPDLHLRTTEEMLQEFSFLKDELLIKKIVIDNPKKLINLIDSNIQPVKSGSYRPKIENVSNKLTEVVYKKAKELYGNHIPELIKTRIDHELSMIIKNDYSIIY
jgi:DNA polymerase-3 subunit alpha (Gram-positive type)